MKKPIVFIDVETTGLSVTKDRIVKISLLKKYPDGKISKGSKLINPGIDIPSEATDIHGITNETIADSPSFDKVAAGVHEYLQDCVIAGYSVERFDLPILIEEFGRSNIEFNTSDCQVIDLHKLYVKSEPRDLDGAYKHYTGGDNSLSDVDAMAAILDKQIEKYDIQDIDTTISDLAADRVDFAGKIVNDNGTAKLTFGKHAGVPVIDVDKDYIKWMLNGDFSHDTKVKLKKLAGV